MSAKTTGVIWDLELPVPKRMVLLAMVDHADHAGAHIYAPIAFIAWKTGYSERNVTRIIQELIADELLMLTSADIGIANEYQFDFSRAVMKPPYRGRMPKRQRSTPDKMSPPTPDKMSGVIAKTGKTPDILSPPPDKMSPPTPDKMAIDHVYTLLDHESTTTTSTNPIVRGGDGGNSIGKKPDKTELYYWLCGEGGVDSPVAAERNQHHDPAATKAFHRKMVGDSVGAERKKLVGRFIRRLDADGPPPIPAPAPNGHYIQQPKETETFVPITEVARQIREKRKS